MFNFAALKLNRTVIKKVILVLIVATVLIGGVMFILDWLSYKNVTFNLSSDTKSIIVYNEDQFETYRESDGNSSVANSGALKSSGVLRLKTDNYHVIPTGDNISSDAIKVKVDDNTESVDINPYYSENYLSNNFSDQVPDINTVISDKYIKIIANYTIENGEFYHYGDWYGTTLYNEPTAEGGSDTYGIILHKVDDKWNIVTTPQIVFRYSDHKDIPSDIIDAVNQNVND